jgi:hypothetical protein
MAARTLVAAAMNPGRFTWRPRWNFLKQGRLRVCAGQAPEGAIQLLNLERSSIQRGTFCQLDISGAILYCLSAILGLADQVCVS